MSWNPFANHVYDEDLCFCRNFVSVINRISCLTTNVAWQAVGQRILSNLDMQNKMREFGDLSARTVVEDCYPSDRFKRMKYASALLELVNSFGFESNEFGSALVPVFEVIKKMELCNSEKEQLIRKYLHPSTGNLEMDNYLIKMWMDNFS